MCPPRPKEHDARQPRACFKRSKSQPRYQSESGAGGKRFYKMFSHPVGLRDSGYESYDCYPKLPLCGQQRSCVVGRKESKGGFIFPLSFKKKKSVLKQEKVDRLHSKGKTTASPLCCCFPPKCGLQRFCFPKKGLI